MDKQVVDTLKLELYEHNIRGCYKTVIWWIFQAQLDLAVSLISRLEGKKGEKYDKVERKSIFESSPLQNMEGNLQIILQDLVFPRVNLSGAIIIWHVGLKQLRFLSLKLLHTCNFNHITRGLACLRDM